MVVKAQLYKNSDYRSLYTSIGDDKPQLNWSGNQYNDVLSSIKVAPGVIARLYEHENYRGKYVEIKGGNNAPNLATLNFNDKTSSIKFVEDK